MCLRIRSKAKEISSILLFTFFLLSFDSRFAFNLEINIFPVLIPYCLIVIILIIKYKAIFQIDIKLKKIWILKILFILPILFSFLFIKNNTDLTSFLNGLIVFIVLYFPLLLLLSHFSSSTQENKNKYLKLYVNSILLIAVISIIEMAIIYMFRIFIFTEILSYFPNLIIQEDASLEVFGSGVPGIVFFRSLGFSGDPSIAGFIYLIGIIIFNEHFKRNKIIINTVLILAIIMTFSSSVVICTLIYFAIIYFRQFSISRIIKSMAFVIALFSILSLRYIAVITHVIRNRFDTGGSANSHLIINGQALKVFFNNPFGVGYKTFGVLHPEIYSAHNSYIQLLVETGIIGFFIFMLWLLYMAVTIYKHKSSYSNTFFYVLSFLIIMSMAHDFFFRFEFVFPLLFLASLSLSYKDNKSRYKSLNA